MRFCERCPQPMLCDPPLHNLLVCSGPGECDPRCPKVEWLARHGETKRAVRN